MKVQTAEHFNFNNKERGRHKDWQRNSKFFLSKLTLCKCNTNGSDTYVRKYNSVTVQVPVESFILIFFSIDNNFLVFIKVQIVYNCLTLEVKTPFLNNNMKDCCKNFYVSSRETQTVTLNYCFWNGTTERWLSQKQNRFQNLNQFLVYLHREGNS